MLIMGLLRSRLCPAIQAQHLCAHKKSGFGKNRSVFRASCAVLSCSAFNDARSSAVGLASFGGTYKAPVLLEYRRCAVAIFSPMLSRERCLIKPGLQSNPLVVALRDGVAGTGDNKWDWRQRKLLQSVVASGGVLTTSAPRLASWKIHHAK